MEKPLFAVIAIGIALGLLLPSPPDDPVVAPGAVRSTPAAPAKRPAASPTRGWSSETKLRPASNGHFYTDALVNGRPVEFIVDTGATTIALTVADARRIGLNVDPARFEMVGSGAGGPVRGEAIMIDSVSVDGKEVRTLQGAVIEGLDVSLLGQSYLSRISEVRMSNGEMVLR